MKVKVKEEFNVFELFVHDNEAVHAICSYELAEAINELLIDSGWRVCPPESLDRFTLWSTNDDEEGYIDRYFNLQQVKESLPVEVVELLEEIDEMSFDLSPDSTQDEVV